MISFPSEMQIYCRFKHGCMRLDIIPSWMILCLCWERDSPVFFLFFFLFVSFSLLFTSLQPLDLREQCWWVWQRSGCAWAYQKKKKRKEKKSKTENKKSVFKRNIWRHCTIPRLISEIFKAKTFSKSTHKEHTKMSYYNCSLFFFKPIGSSLLEKKSTHANIMHAIKIHQDKTGYSSRAFN